MSFLFSDKKGLQNRSGMNYLFCLELIVKGFQHLRNFYFGANERYKLQTISQIIA